VLKKYALSSFLNMAGLAAARMSGGSEFQVRHARGRAVQTWFTAMASGTCYWKPIAGQYLLLRFWTMTSFEIRWACASVYSVHDRT